MTPSTTTSAATPTITPPVAISVLSERKRALPPGLEVAARDAPLEARDGERSFVATGSARLPRAQRGAS